MIYMYIYAAATHSWEEDIMYSSHIKTRLFSKAQLQDPAVKELV